MKDAGASPRRELPQPPWAPELVIFDVFNTLVRPRWGRGATFVKGLRRAGVRASPQLLSQLQQLSESLVHEQWSASRKAYVDWAKATFALVKTLGCSPVERHAAHVVPALEQLHQAPMRAFPGVRTCLAGLRSRKVTIAVCSNWSWDLRDDLRRAGLDDLVDIVVTSAQVGARKPHPSIYRRVLDLAGAAPAKALFVGDSLAADVEGPMREGIPAVHLVRSGRPTEAGWSMRDLPLLTSLIH